MADPLINRQVGKYLIQQEIGRGGMARVYRATDTLLQRTVALKVLSPQLGSDPEFAQRFEREAITAANLRHPAIITIFDVGEADGLRYIAMEYIAGRTLADVLDERDKLSLALTISVLAPVAEALQYAHDLGAVHRDIKPHNIMLDTDGRVLLTDFGIAIRPSEESQKLTQAGLFMGTPEYISPEQAQAQPLNGCSDMYALGVVAYELLAGQPPFRGSVPELIMAHVYTAPPAIRTLDPTLPAELDLVFSRVLAKRADQRFEKVTGFVEALRRVGERYGVGPAPRSALAALAVAQNSSAGAATVRVATPAAALDGEIATVFGPPPTPPAQPPVQPPLQPRRGDTPRQLVYPRGEDDDRPPPPRRPTRSNDRPSQLPWNIIAAVVVVLVLIGALLLSRGRSNPLAFGIRPSPTGVADGFIQSTPLSTITVPRGPTPTLIPTPRPGEPTFTPTVPPPPTAAPTAAPPTAVVPTNEIPPTAAPLTEPAPTTAPTTAPIIVVPTDVPPTDVPPTDVPPTAVPPTDVPPTNVPPTAVPPTDIPPTAVPPTDVPPIAAPTDIPPTAAPTAGTLIGGGGHLALQVGRALQLFDVVQNKTITIQQDAGSAGPAALSPDGRTLLFDAQVNGQPQLQRFNLDDQQITPFIKGLNTSYHAAWSADGTRVVFASSDGGSPELYIASSDGTVQGEGGTPQPLTTSPATDDYPTLSAAGQLLFETDRDGPSGAFALYTLDAGGATRFSTPGQATSDRYPRFAPDGKSVAFVSNRDRPDGGFELYVQPLVGGVAQRITTFPSGSVGGPTWSPDGQLLAFSSDSAGRSDIFLVRADGSNLLNLTNSPNDDERWPVWGK